MQGKILGLLVISLTVLSVVLASCTTPDTQQEFPGLLPEEVLRMTETEAAQMAERGFVNVSTIEDASRIAGYTVAMPAYIPEGFHGGGISVEKPGFMLPKEDYHGLPMRVERIWSWEGSLQGKSPVMFIFTQTPQPFSLGSGEPAEVCGVAGERMFKEAEADMPAKLALYWRRDDMSYKVWGLLGGPLDEETLGKIACSVGSD